LSNKLLYGLWLISLLVNILKHAQKNSFEPDDTQGKLAEKPMKRAKLSDGSDICL
jgi:hypothetical protein